MAADDEIKREMAKLKRELIAMDKQSRFMRERRKNGKITYILRKGEENHGKEIQIHTGDG